MTSLIRASVAARCRTTGPSEQSAVSTTRNRASESSGQMPCTASSRLGSRACITPAPALRRREEANGLEGPGDAEAGNVVGHAAGDVAAVGVNTPRRHPLEAGEHVDQRALARAVRADQAEDLIPCKLEREILERGEAPETDGDPVRSESLEGVGRAHKLVHARRRPALTEGTTPRSRRAAPCLPRSARFHS